MGISGPNRQRFDEVMVEFEETTREIRRLDAERARHALNWRAIADALNSMPGSVLTAYKGTFAAIDKDELIRILEATASLKETARRLEAEKATLNRQLRPPIRTQGPAFAAGPPPK